MSKANKAPLSLSRLVKFIKGKDGQIAVVVGFETNDIRVYEVPSLKVCALRFTETARARIDKASGECLTFNQLARRAPLGQNTVLLIGHKKATCDTIVEAMLEITDAFKSRVGLPCPRTKSSFQSSDASKHWIICKVLTNTFTFMLWTCLSTLTLVRPPSLTRVRDA